MNRQIHYRTPPRDGFVMLPTWEVTWYEGEHGRYRAEQLTGELPTVHFCEALASDNRNTMIKGIRIDGVEVQVFPPVETEPIDEMTLEQLQTEVRHLRQLNIDQGKVIAKTAFQ